MLRVVPWIRRRPRRPGAGRLHQRDHHGGALDFLRPPSSRSGRIGTATAGKSRWARPASSASFLCPLLEMRPFSGRPPPWQIIFLFRWLIIRIMLGSALIKLRGDACWTDLTALYYHFETQPIPNPFSRYFHFMPHGRPAISASSGPSSLQLIAPFFCLWPRWGRYIAAEHHHLVPAHAHRLRQSLLLQLAHHPARTRLLR